MTDETRGQILFIPYGDNPVRVAAAALAARVADGRYGDVAVIAASNATRHELYRRLLTANSAFGAIVPPFVGTWEQWCTQLMPERRPPDRRVAELMLEEQLDQNTDANWRSALTASLLSLFDDLALSGNTPNNETHFDAVVRRGYGISQPSRPLSDEARLVANAWRHWRAFLKEHHGKSDSEDESDITHFVQTAKQYSAVYWLAPTHISLLQARVLRALSISTDVVLIVPSDNTVHGTGLDASTIAALDFAIDNRAQTSRARSAFLSNVYAAHDAQPLAPRAHNFAAQYCVSPIRGDLTLLELPALDDEAHAIELQIREWWLQGKRHIAVITFDRKLARRVRALLERTGLDLHDATGWPLSTTSAASLLEIWLNAIEQNFPVAAVTALLSSSLLHTTGATLEQHKQIAGRWLAVARRAHIFRGLRAQRALAQMHSAESEAAAPIVARWLHTLEQASAGLSALQRRRTRRSVFVATLIESLQQLDTTENFIRDPAGRAIFDELEAMRAAAQSAKRPIEWSEFRRWLRHRLEIGYFEPPMRREGVALLTLAQAELGQFDAVVLANVSEESLGTTAATPFFNDAVRAELGLPTTRDQRRIRLRQLRGVLDRNEKILMTVRHQDEGARLTLARWIERLQAFHRIAYGDGLEDRALATHAQAITTWMARPEPKANLPAPASMPRPSSPLNLVPAEFSASSLQQLIDCPYQFFVARQLRLAAGDDSEDAFGKREYGERVHKILQAFHIGVAGLPGPQAEPITPATAAQARTLLEQISNQVFAPDTASGFLVRGWRSRWQRVLPDYLDWLQQRPEWTTTHAEAKLERSLANGARLVGRVDRIDQHGDAVAVIDYKTGAVPKREAIERCEKIQLPFYALLAGDLGAVAAVSYLALDRTVREHSLNRDNGLESVVAFLEERIGAVGLALNSGINLPAWADEGTCAYCDFSGVCRRGLWQRAELDRSLDEKKGGP